MLSHVQTELARRLRMWESLKTGGGPDGVRPEVIKDLRLHRGQQAVFRDLDVTGSLTGYSAGVTVGVLHTGSSHAGDLSEDGIVYHHPLTNRGSRDSNEVRATKACGELSLPLFVIITPERGSPVRNVRLGWVIDFDDPSKQILIRFSENAQPLLRIGPASHDAVEFQLQVERHRGEARTTTRPTQWRFRFDVMKRYGSRCAVCDLRQPALLQAAHLCPVEAGGSDDPRNGLIFCLNHHRAFDLGLLRIDPDSLEVLGGWGVESLADLGVNGRSIGHLPRPPHPDARGRTHSACCPV